MEPRVEIASGRIEGCREDGVLVFRGIPYARPPQGALRLRAPLPPVPWSGVRDAKTFGPAAPQNPGRLAALLGNPTEIFAEDCLFLNVWTPAADAGRRPVLVWLHGGAFTTGSGSQPVYRGARLAQRGDAVVVTVNYRLGSLGFLHLPALAREAGDASANFGLLDQLAALAWVQENIAAFGGDPGNVTVFGESAGAMSVGTLLGTPRARGLFSRAILQSGAASNVYDQEDAIRVAETFLKELGLTADDAEGLRARPLEAVLAAQERAVAQLLGVVPQLPFQPVVDGDVLPRPPLDAIAAGLSREVSVLIGTNLEEQKLYSPTDPKAQSLDEDGLLRRCRRTLPAPGPDGRPRGEHAIQRYRAAREGRFDVSPRELWYAIETDRWFRVPAMRLAEQHAAHQPATYAYLFTWKSPALGGMLGSCHALEIPFVFGCVDDRLVQRFVGDHPAAAGVSLRMQDAWLAFARTGVPASPDLGDWPRYDAARRATMLFGEECRVEDAPFEAERAFWDETG
ncbi:MAG TPA: carboxylesterase/lipase family protein [Myxococcota bacterium]|jgi:para-nitrobenzyl esterase